MIRAHMLTPMQIGAVPWRGPDPAMTLVIKATFSLAADGVVAYAPEQASILDDEVCDGDTEELSYASDFVPRKRRVDLLLSGHAYAPAPARSIDFGIAVDDFGRRLRATSTVATDRIPLTTPWVTDPSTNAPARVGPRSDWDPRCGFPIDVARFDFEAFNAAPTEQRLGRVAENATITLLNLIEGVGARTVQLPGIAPVVFAPALWAHPVALALSLDTLVIDTDARTVAVVWRTTIETDARDFEVVVGVAPSGAQLAWSHLAPSVRAARVVEASTPAPLEGSSPSLDPNEMTDVMTSAPAASRGMHTETIAAHTLPAMSQPTKAYADIVTRVADYEIGKALADEGDDPGPGSRS